jgi:perosamine synthetase
VVAEVTEQIAMSRPDINEDDISAVTSVLRSGQLSIGPFLERFEQAMATYIGTRDAVAVNSGTSGLHLCMRLAGITAGTEVITSPFSFIASANCIVYDGGTPVFADIDEDTLGLDPDAAKQAITPRTKALLPIHVFGQAANLSELAGIAASHDLQLIEDACEAIGTEYKGRRVGTTGKAGVFAFYPNKQITTGEGGVVVTDDKHWAAQLRSLRNQGRWAMGGWLDHDQIGFNFRLDEMSAALGWSQLARIDALLALRREVAEKYTANLTDIPGARPLVPPPDTTRMSWFVYPVRLEPGLPRNEIAEHLRASGIPTRNYFPPIHLQPFYRERFGYRAGQFPVTERISGEILALPFHARLSDEEIERVCTGLRQAIDKSTGSSRLMPKLSNVG